MTNLSTKSLVVVLLCLGGNARAFEGGHVDFPPEGQVNFPVEGMVPFEPRFVDSAIRDQALQAEQESLQPPYINALPIEIYSDIDADSNRVNSSDQDDDPVVQQSLDLDVDGNTPKSTRLEAPQN